MAKLAIIQYNYNTRCDTNRCANRAAVSLGIKGEPPGTYHNLCNECLESVVHDAPIHMVLEREDVKAHIAKQVQEILFNAGITPPEEPGSASANLEHLREMPWAELRALGKEYELPGWGQMKRVDMEAQVAAILDAQGIVLTQEGDNPATPTDGGNLAPEGNNTTPNEDDNPTPATSDSNVPTTDGEAQ